ncbi:hydantoin utilization protein A [Hwanghaeella grinnelliae]|uniref:Hydantoin utilization protein A n=1 Tax=Hwanghaeella grinnelliae TaxID=2500179 RepID=A0A437QND9_9PROT|nr:HupE/UreJ family protein [Hwanghaeella grinnelliae]RVU36043.1 hydantoin utilization protein A [Hwanghaeella grinnelliae]
MRQIFLAGVLLTTFASPAFAHHAMGGAPMETFGDGLLSGIGHPLLGFDHLFFVVAMGIAALFTGRKYLTPAAYIGGMLIGCYAMYAGIGLPMKEAVIGLSLLVVGGIVLSGRGLSAGAFMALFLVFGLFHGSAFGDSMAAQEGGVGGAVLIGYLIGLGALQYGVALAAGRVAETLFKVSSPKAIEARLAGAVVAGVGLFLSLETAEGIVMNALGWGV